MSTLEDRRHLRRRLARSEFAEHIERARSRYREISHAELARRENRPACQYLGPYEPCERCGVPVVGIRRYGPDGSIVFEDMREITRIDATSEDQIDPTTFNSEVWHHSHVCRR